MAHSFVLWCVSSAFCAIVLSRLLSPRLDPIFKDELYMYTLASELPGAMVRAGVYACWVTIPAFSARWDKRARNFDFTPYLNKFTYVLCWLHTINCLMMFVWIPLGVYLKLTSA